MCVYDDRRALLFAWTVSAERRWKKSENESVRACVCACTKMLVSSLIFGTMPRARWYNDQAPASKLNSFRGSSSERIKSVPVTYTHRRTTMRYVTLFDCGDTVVF